LEAEDHAGNRSQVTRSLNRKEAIVDKDPPNIVLHHPPEGFAFTLFSRSFWCESSMDSIAKGDTNKLSGCFYNALAQRNKGPLAIVTLHSPDYNLVEGAIVAGIPFVSDIDPQFFQDIQTGMVVTIRHNKCFVP